MRQALPNNSFNAGSGHWHKSLIKQITLDVFLLETASERGRPAQVAALDDTQHGHR
jgi:hypothetical protein